MLCLIALDGACRCQAEPANVCFGAVSNLQASCAGLCLRVPDQGSLEVGWLEDQADDPQHRLKQIHCCTPGARYRSAVPALMACLPVLMLQVT